MIKAFLLLLISSLLPQLSFARNISENHPSPYVRLHANDAVKWQLWDGSVLQRAQKENKLIFISSGYYACHWCHVMRKETFDDEQVARVLNENFISVKLDRELNSVVDAYLMEFLEKTQGRGGWPLNVVLTPDGYPLTGMVYLPKYNFLKVMRKLNNRWLKQSDELNAIARNIFQHTQRESLQLKNISANNLLKKLMVSVEESADDFEGGFGNRAKFPRPYLLMSLLKVYEDTRDADLKEFLVLTLNQMVEQGLYDAVGSGFFRYTIDQSWKVPHFEKMLYTNAAMIKLYVQAYKIFADQKWLQVAEQTQDFIMRDMKYEKGGYVGSLSAQDKNEIEGGNYIWQKEELMGLLNARQQSWFEKNVQFTQVPESEAVMPLGFWQGDEAEEIKPLLLNRRQQNKPLKDNKFNISWNAYLLISMVELAAVSDKPRYKQAANEQFNLLKNLADSRLVRNSQIHGQRYLEDYVFLAYAMWSWSDQLSKAADDSRVDSLLNEALQRFLGGAGWRESDGAIIPLPGESLVSKDGNLPSAAVYMSKLVKARWAEKARIRVKLRDKLRDVALKVDVSTVENPLESSSYIIELCEQSETGCKN